MTEAWKKRNLLSKKKAQQLGITGLAFARVFAAFRWRGNRADGDVPAV